MTDVGGYRIFTSRIEVAAADMDMQQRVSNVRYVEWMQDIAVAHSAAQGWSMERYAAVGQGWVVHRHTITYKRPAVAGDVLLVATWVAEYASRQCLRRYCFLRQADGAVLAEAETAWMYIDMTTGRAIRVPDALRHDFAVVTDEEEVRSFLQAAVAAS